MIQIAIFASGGGSNTEKIIERFRGHATIRVAVIVTNKAGAGVVTIADHFGIPVIVLDKVRFMEDGYVDELDTLGIEWIVLAGFLWKIPGPLLSSFPGKIINIHPALLPNYGGKGMFGRHVHEAVLAAGETESGMTIHYVDGEYDHGDTIFQATCEVKPGDTPAILASRIQELEHLHYPGVIEELINRPA